MELGFPKQCKTFYYVGWISKPNNKVKATWKVVKSISGKNVKKEDLQFLKIDGELTDNHSRIAESLNNYFLSIADNIKGIENYHIPGTDPGNYLKYFTQAFVNPLPRMYFKHTTFKEVESIIRSFKPKSSKSYDEISTEILKCSVPFISSPLAHICNRVFESGVFPNRLKYSVIKPVFKDGDMTDMSNYRPISLMTSFSKVLEKLIYIRMLQHIKNNNILAKEQFGFRRKSSTAIAAFHLVNEILTTLNNGRFTGGNFLRS
jgi:hypothetical protein